MDCLQSLEKTEFVRKVVDDMDKRYEELKRELFDWGYDYIEEFLGCEIDYDWDKDTIDNLNSIYADFDCSEETYLWLDSTGHGTNGAPYDMKDLYEDMEACQEMIMELYRAFESAEEEFL